MSFVAVDRGLDAGAPWRLRPPRRFRRRLLFALAAAGLGPLLVWGLLGRSVLSGVLAVAPPVSELLQRSADALDRPPGAHAAGDAALAADLRQAELQIVQADLARRRLLDWAPLSFGFALGSSAFLVAAAAWWLGRRLSRPVESLASAMVHFGRGDLDHEVPVTGREDELDYLAHGLNRMRRELARQRDRLQVTEALAAWRDAARGLAHDLKNPLTAMRMALGRLTRPGRSEDALGEAVSLLQDELDVLIRMSQSFSEFARLPDPQRAPLDLAALVEDVAALYGPDSAPARLDVVARVRPIVFGDADQLRRALGNLVKNAIEASRAVGGAIGVTVTAADEPDRVQVVVRDQGKGIANTLEGGELMRGLLSSKESGRRGLGLPIAHKIVHDHGGRLRLGPAPGRGTEAIVELPVTERPLEATTAAVAIAGARA